MTIPTQFPQLMAVAAAAGEGGLDIEPVAITRGEALSLTFSLPEHPVFGDYTDGAMALDLLASPNAATPLASYAVTTGTPAGALTPFVANLTTTQTGALPAPSATTQLGELFLRVAFTPTDGSRKTIAMTRQLVKG